MFYNRNIKGFVWRNNKPPFQVKPFKHWSKDAAHIDSVSLIFKTGSTFKSRNSLGLDFTALTHLYFSVALYMYYKALVVALFIYISAL